MTVDEIIKHCDDYITSMNKYADTGNIGWWLEFYHTILNGFRELKALKAQQTCENINEDYADCDQFKCSECQIELQDWHRVERDEDDGEISYHEYTFRYCPNCGRRVKEVEKDDE